MVYGKLTSQKPILLKTKAQSFQELCSRNTRATILAPLLTCLTVAAALLPSDTSRSRIMQSGWRPRRRPADPHPNHFVRANTNKQARSFGWPGERDPDLSSAQGSR